jgi:GH25 family lysozyme M1 (1,4-beta-N-acetylmuramidase)
MYLSTKERLFGIRLKLSSILSPFGLYLLERPQEMISWIPNLSGIGPPSKKSGIIRGAYHYYRPNENSLDQAEFFIKHVDLQKGNLPPILDIESMLKNQPMDSLKSGLRRWLTKVDQHYKIRPIIYTNESYYEDFLKEDFSDFPFWFAN